MTNARTFFFVVVASHGPCLSRAFLQFLAELGIGAENPGFYNGKWGGSGALATAVNPANGKPIATVRQATVEEYESCVAAMTAAQEAWQLVRKAVHLLYTVL